MAKAVGIGGVFLKAKEPKALTAWYSAHLGIDGSEDGSLVFQENSEKNAGGGGMTVFAHFPTGTAYFGGGPQQAMINFRVDNLDQLLAQLAEAGVRIDPKREEYSYGRFAWIWDLEGNRVELWEPLR